MLQVKCSSFSSMPQHGILTRYLIYGHWIMRILKNRGYDTSSSGIRNGIIQRCLIVATPQRWPVPIMRPDSIWSQTSAHLVMLPIAATPLIHNPKCQSRPSITANQHTKLTALDHSQFYLTSTFSFQEIRKTRKTVELNK